MQRSPHLASFSRDHHESLVIVSRIQLAVKQQKDLSDLQHVVRKAWTDHLSVHFRAEEELLIPVLFDIGADDLMRRLIDEHRQVTARIDALLNGPGSAEQYSDLVALLKEHIRFEERLLFPTIEERCTQETLEYIGSRLNPESI